MKNLTKITLIAIITMGLNACGGKSVPSEIAEVELNTTQEVAEIPQEVSKINKILIDSICDGKNAIEDYTLLQKGDMVAKEDDNTTITFYHNQDGQKVACVNYGTAFILREVN